MNGRSWTTEEDVYLKRSWESSKKKEEIADHLNRSVEAVHARACTMKVVSGRWWANDEIEYLKSNWNLQSALEISRILSRSVNAIQLKTKSMKLKGGRKRASLARRTGKIVRCANCGREFYKAACFIRERNFCNSKCQTAVVNRELLRLKSSNKSELVLDALLQANFPGEYRFNGDYSQGVTLGGLIPDWINVDGKKQVIELFGEYWHDGKRKRVRWKSTEFGRRAVFSQLGFECLIVWGNELKSPDELVKKIRSFI